jgi:hypothetical protein
MAYVGLPILPAYDYEDQGAFGTCVGNGIAHQLDWEALTAFPGQQIKFSPLFIYRNAKVIEGNWDEGTNPNFAYQSLIKQGVCLEQDYPYSTLTDVHNIPAPSQDAVNKALTYRIKSVTQLDGSIAAIDKALDAKKAVNVGTLVTDNFVQAPDQGFIDLPEGTLDGGHDYVIFARDDELTHTFPNGKAVTGFYYIQNSWKRQQILMVAKEFIGFHFDFGAPILSGAWIVDTGWGSAQPAAPAPVTPQTVIELYIGKTDAYVNGHQTILPTAPIIQNNVSLVPDRFIGEALGCTVEWNEQFKKITLRK